MDRSPLARQLRSRIAPTGPRKGGDAPPCEGSQAQYERALPPMSRFRADAGAVAFLRSGRRAPPVRWPRALDSTTWKHHPERPPDSNPTPEMLRQPGLARGAAARDPRCDPQHHNPHLSFGRRESRAVWLLQEHGPTDAGVWSGESRCILGRGGRSRSASVIFAGSPRGPTARDADVPRRGAAGRIGGRRSPIAPARGGEGGRQSSPDPLRGDRLAVVDRSGRETEAARSEWLSSRVPSGLCAHSQLRTRAVNS
jgi:hypothetical protein